MRWSRITRSIINVAKHKQSMLIQKTRDNQRLQARDNIYDKDSDVNIIQDMSDKTGTADSVMTPHSSAFHLLDH